MSPMKKKEREKKMTKVWEKLMARSSKHFTSWKIWMLIDFSFELSADNVYYVICRYICYRIPNCYVFDSKLNFYLLLKRWYENVWNPNSNNLNSISRRLDSLSIPIHSFRVFSSNWKWCHLLKNCNLFDRLHCH